MLSQGQIRNRATELGLTLGFSNYQGDVAPDWRWENCRPAFGVSLKRTTTPYFAYSLGLNYGEVRSEDRLFRGNNLRNLSFKSPVLEFTFQPEFNFFPFAIGNNKRSYTPYIYTGISYFNFNPQAEFNDEWHELQPLSTEGQGLSEEAPKPYSRWAFAVPVGGGIKFALADRWNLLIHAGYRKTFTDYLDDVSGSYADNNLIRAKRGDIAAALADRTGEKTGDYLGMAGHQRGNPELKDWYVFSGFTLSYVLNRPFCYSFRKPGFFLW